LGGGCNACHLQYSRAVQRLFIHWQLSEARNQTWPKLHPRLAVDIPDEKCFACHSRSGRISTNYQGWHETLMQAHEAHGIDSLKVLDDRRVFRFVSSDVHHQAGMRCVDCHISWELMGDGARYLHKEEQTRVQCTDCHSRDFTGKTENYHTDADLVRLGRVLNFDPDTIPMVVTRKGGYGLYNTRIAANGDKFLIGKADGKKRTMKPPASVCSEGTVHQRLDCAACHTAWAPSCIGCHNAFDERITAFDHLQGRFVKGGWEEYQGTFLADAPALGVWKDGQGERIITVVPGMVLTIDTASFSGRSGAPLFRRLFAPAAAHTVSRKGLACRECHNSPNALGFGRGSLTLSGRGAEARWMFMPRFDSRMEDGLPEDAWVQFPDGKSGSATRTGLRPFNNSERQKILRVGACLD
ncbi:MAG: hypothetical protein IH599_07085, partial [Bacteroidales bacterium]|nr:hypothetical protein [Bacteroidales bacterium]